MKNMIQLTQKYLNQIAYEVMGCAIEVNKHAGPGLLESVYESCMMYELQRHGLRAQSQVRVPVFYRGIDLGSHLFIDILVEDGIVLELKAVESLQPIHEAQLLTYLKLTDNYKGILINFNTTKITDKASAKHFVTEKFADLPKE